MSDRERDAAEAWASRCAEIAHRRKMAEEARRAPNIDDIIREVRLKARPRRPLHKPRLTSAAESYYRTVALALADEVEKLRARVQLLETVDEQCEKRALLLRAEEWERRAAKTEAECERLREALSAALGEDHE